MFPQTANFVYFDHDKCSTVINYCKNIFFYYSNLYLVIGAYLNKLQSLVTPQTYDLRWHAKQCLGTDSYDIESLYNATK